MSDFKPFDAEFEARVRAFITGMPITRLLGLELARLGPGSSELVLPYREELSQGGGIFQAGVIGALADIAGGAAAGTLLPSGQVLMTVDYTVKLVAPGAGERLIARGEVAKPGHSLTVTSANVFASKEGRERLCAVALVTTMAIDLPKARRPDAGT
jgi:uncharacterized protein (TIGR00369 family)